MRETGKEREKWVRQPPDVRRRQILDAAAMLIVESGYDRMTMDRIAEAVGVAKGTVYLYYSSKQAVLAGLQADMLDRMSAIPRRLAEQSDLSRAEQLDQLVAGLIEVELAQPQLYHALFHETGLTSDEPAGQIQELLLELLEDGQAAGDFEIDDLEYTASFLLHGHIGTCWHLSDADPETVAAATRSLQSLFRRALGADPLPAS